MISEPDAESTLGPRSVDTTLTSIRLLGEGLANHDNICYANAILVCTASIVLWRPTLLSQLPRALRDVLLSLLGPGQSRDSSSSSSPINLVTCFPALFEGWALGEHEDAYEFLSHLLSGHRILDMIHTQHETRWHRSGRTIEETQDHHVLSLGFELNSGVTNEEESAGCSLKDMLATWLGMRQDEGDWFQSQTALTAVSPILVVHLQRFRMHQGRVCKIRQAVTFEERLSLTLQSGQLVQYQLRAVVVHHGMTATAGHYTAYVADADAGYAHCDDLMRSSRRLTQAQLVRLTDREVYMFFFVRL